MPLKSESDIMSNKSIGGSEGSLGSKNKKKKYNSLYLIGGIIVSVAVVLGLVLLALSYKDKGDKPKTTTSSGQTTTTPPGQTTTTPPSRTTTTTSAQNCIGSWGGWSRCSASCGGGIKTRTYTIQTPARGTGTQCPHANNYQESSPCNSSPCPINCSGSWGDWSQCSAPCGEGTKTRTYTIQTSAQYGGSPCPHTGEYHESSPCNSGPCPCDSIQCNGDLRRKKTNANTLASINIVNDNDFNSDCCEWNTPTSFTPGDDDFEQITGRRPLRDSQHKYNNLYQSDYGPLDSGAYYTPDTDSFNRAQNYSECPPTDGNPDITDWTPVDITDGSEIICKGYNITNSNGDPNNFSYITSGHPDTTDETCNACKCPDNYAVQFHENLVQFRCLRNGEGDDKHVPFYVPTFE